MRIIRFETLEDWLAGRVAVITGKKAKGAYPKKRGADKEPPTIWEILAEKIAEAPDGEKDNDRGNRLEEPAMDILSSQIGKEIDTSKCIWLSDDNDSIGVSPDAFEKAEVPTWAVELKCLKTPTHLKHVIRHIKADKASEGYNPIDYVPSEAPHYFREQVIQYFITNNKLETLYFVFYDDRISPEYMRLAFHVIEIHRKDVEEEIATQKQYELDVLSAVNQLIKEFTEG